MTNATKDLIRRILPRANRHYRILSGQVAGQVIYTSPRDYPGAILGTTERPLLEWFSRNVSPGETWIDAGAHFGYTALALCRLVGPQGRVVAFEPVLGTAGCIARTRERNQLRQLRIVPMGLSASPTLQTRLFPSVRGMADSTIGHTAWEEPVSLIAFDTLWSLLCDGNPAVHGIKIDVQGMEIEVLSGMQDVLKAQRPKLIVEFHTGVDRGKALELLASCGYSEPGTAIDTELQGTSSYQDDYSYAFLKPQTV